MMLLSYGETGECNARTRIASKVNAVERFSNFIRFARSFGEVHAEL